MKSQNSYSLSGKIVDLVKGQIFRGTVDVQNGKIQKITHDELVQENQTILPGLIDSHIHIESSMLIPSEFARLAVVHGTVCTVSDPHEIANVLGITGVKFMIENGKKVPFKFYFGAPSCVPATPFETSGAQFTPNDLEELLSMNEIHYLSEMMNFPGVINGSLDEIKKIDIAKKHNKPVDGHAPGVKGEDARKYAEAGVTTDHECFTMEEALEKIRYGMKIQIREGSAAKNFEALIDLMKDHADKVLFCSDDRHPDNLAEGHINDLIKRAVAKGYDPIQVLKSVILNPVEHYHLNVGLLQEGDPADMIVVDNLKDFNIKATYINGQKVAENGQTLLNPVEEIAPNNFLATPITQEDIQVKDTGKKIRVIEAYDGELITGSVLMDPKSDNGNLVSDTEKDVLKMVVLNRYQKAEPAVAFIKNIGLKKGAFASSVAHDSHNIVAVGANDEEIVQAINAVVKSKGGVVVVNEKEEHLLSLPVAGLMSNQDGYAVAKKYKELDTMLHEMGATLRAPFMTLSFMALLVIPELKLSDKGLFDGNSFSFTSLYAEN
ncbi:MAG: adenine deaminase [Bacteroidales bacterium]|nr:adenine deaminase [Bacteroidales bacterium]